MALGNSQTSPRLNGLGLAAIAWVVAGGLLLGAASLFYPWTQRDTPSAAYIGATILDGGAPYRDAWNIKGPGINFAYALSILLFGKSAAGLRLFDLLWQIATALVISCVALRMYRKRMVGILAGIVYLTAYFSQDYNDWAEPDGLLSLPLLLGLLFFLRAFEADALLLWALAGAGAGVAAVLKLPMGIVGIAFLAFAMVREGRTIDRTFLRPLALAGGFCLPLAAVGLFLFIRNALPDFLTAQFVLAPEFVARLRAVSTWSCIGHSLSRPNLFFFYALAVAGFAPFARAGGRGPRVSPAVAVLLAWIGAATVTLVMHGAWLRYHYLPFAAPLAILAADPLVTLCSAARERGARGSRIALALAGLSLAPSALGVAGHYRDVWRLWGAPEKPGRWQALGLYLRDRTAPGEHIFVWGNVPVVYLYAERKAASRFLSTYFLSVPWRRVDYRPVFLAEFAASKPRYFVLVEEPPHPPCMDQEEGGSLGGFERLTALRKIVEDDYEIEKTERYYVVYRRKASAAPPG